MTTIDRLIVRTFLGSYVLLLVLFSGLFIFFDLLVNFDEFSGEQGLPLPVMLRNMADFYGHNLLMYYHLLGGLLLGIAGSYTFAMMLRNNELMPLIASGVPLQRLATPVLVAAIGLAGLWMAHAEFVLPQFAEKVSRRHGELVETGRTEVPLVIDDRDAKLNAAELKPELGLLQSVYIIEPTPAGGLPSLVRADSAKWDPEARTWRLVRGARQRVGAALADAELGASVLWEELDEYPFGLAPDQIVLRQSAQWINLMSIQQMTALLQSRNLPNLPEIARQRDIRFTQPLLSWVLLLLSIRFFLTREQGHVLVAGGWALLVAGGCFVFTFFCHSMSGDPRFVRLAVWLPVLVFGPAAVILFGNVKT